MIFVLSPSKTMSVSDLGRKAPLLKENTLRIQSELSAYSVEEVAKSYKVSNKLLEETYELIQNFDKLGTKPAIELYEGSVFKGLKLEIYTKEELAYLKKSVRILSAFYGLLTPYDHIKPYRLDMKHPIFRSLGKDYWEKDINEGLPQKGTIVCLASEEFSQLISKPMVYCQFFEGLGGELKVKSTYAKVARGLMLHFAITNQCKSLNDLKAFNLGGYSYQEHLDSVDEKGNRFMIFARA